MQKMKLTMVLVLFIGSFLAAHLVTFVAANEKHCFYHDAKAMLSIKTFILLHTTISQSILALKFST